MSNSKSFITAIFLAAVLIAASAACLGRQIKQSQSDIDEKELAAHIKNSVLAELQSGTHMASQKEALISALNDEGVIENAVDAGIKRFLAKQQEAKRKVAEERNRIAQEKAKKVHRVSNRDHIYGDPKAKISLIEYSDFECPFCKRFHPNPKQVVDTSNYQVNWVYHRHPLQFHNPGAQKQAEAPECEADLVGNEAFWKFTNLIYERTTSNGRGFPLENLLPLAEEIGLERSAFMTCLETEKHAEKVKQDMRDGQASGIDATPGTIILNNDTGAVKLVFGAQPVEALKAAIDELLK